MRKQNPKLGRGGLQSFIKKALVYSVNFQLPGILLFDLANETPKWLTKKFESKGIGPYVGFDRFCKSHMLYH